MIKTVIVEDERPNQEVLMNYLEAYCPDVEVVAVASTLQEGLDKIAAQQPDLIFLDIKLDAGNSGFDLLEKIEAINFQIIFVTAYDEYIKKALNETEALYYITKPIKISELETAVAKAAQKLQILPQTPTVSPAADVTSEQIKALLRQINPERKIAIPIDKGLEFVTITDIIRIEALGNFVQVHLSQRKKLTVYQNLTHYENELTNAQFMRVHRSHLVNLREVKSFQNRGKAGTIFLNDGSEIQISAGNKKEFLQRLQELY
ncbi:MAG: LytTR family DNA-binding domain-containing protein [Bacteroidota bacterium]